MRLKKAAYPVNPSPSSFPIPHQEASHGIGTGTLVGACVGSSLLVLTLLAATWILYRRRFNGRKYDAEKQFVLRKPSSAIRSPHAVSPPKPTVVPTTLRKSPSPPHPKTGSGDQGSPEGSGKLEDITPEKHEKESLGEEEKNPPLGQLHFQLKYEEDKSSLLVTVVKCTGLTTCDPYVKLQLLPEKQHRVKTRVMRKTSKPVYDEDFTFYGIDPDALAATTLHFVVLSFDRYSRDDIIGEVIFPMSALALEKLHDKRLIVREITPRNLKIRNQGHGELLVSLCHQPAASRLTVVVLKARNLPKLDLSGVCDPYIKIYLLYNGQRIAKKKTHVKKKTTNPVYNESFVFEVPYEEGLDNISLEFVALDWDRVTKNEVIGRLELSNQAAGSALRHWREVQASPRRQIAEWHRLRE